MTENIEIGTSVKVDGLDELEKIAQHLQKVVEVLSNNTQDGVLKFGFDETTLKRVENVITSLKNAFLNATKHIPKKVSIDLELTSDSVGKIRNQIRNLLQQSLSQVGGGGGGGGRPPGGGGGGGGNPPNDPPNDPPKRLTGTQEIKAIEAAYNSLNDEAADLIAFVEGYNRTIRQATAASAKFVQEVRGGFNSLSSSGPLAFLETASKVALKDLREFSKKLVAEFARLEQAKVRNDAKLQSGARTEKDHGEKADRLEQNTKDLTALAAVLEKHVRLQERTIEQSRKARTEEKKAIAILKESAMLKQQVVDLSARGGAQSVAEIRSFIDGYQRTNQLLTESLKRNANQIGDVRHEIALTENELKGYESRLLEIHNLLKSKTTTDDQRKALVAEKIVVSQSLKLLRKATDAREQTIESYQRSARLQQQERVETRGILNNLNEEYRTLQNIDKIREDSVKRAQRLLVVSKNLRNEAAGSFQGLASSKDSQVDDGVKEATEEAGRYLSKLQARYRDLKASVVELKNTQQGLTDQLRADAASGSNEFSKFKGADGSVDAAGSLDHLNNKIAEVDKRFEKMLNDAQTELKEIGTTIDGVATNIGGMKNKISVFDDLGKRLNKGSQAADNLSLRFREIVKQSLSVKSASDILVNVEAIRRAEGEVKALDTTINKLRADMTIAATTGDGIVSPKMIAEMQQLTEKREKLNKVLRDPVYIQNANQLKFLEGQIQKTTGASTKFGIATISLKADWDRAIKGLASGGVEAERAAKDLLKLGSTATSLASDVRETLRSFDLMKEVMGELSPEQQAEVASLKKMEEAFNSTSLAVVKSTGVLKDFEAVVAKAKTQTDAAGTASQRALATGSAIRGANFTVDDKTNPVSERDNELVKQAAKNLSELKNREEALIRTTLDLKIKAREASNELKAMAASSTGLFEGLDRSTPEGAQKSAQLLQALLGEVEAKAKKASKSIKEELEDIGTAVKQVSEPLVDLKRRTEVFNDLDKRATKAKGAVENLSKRLKDIQKAPRSNSSDLIRLNVENINKAESELAGLGVQLRKLRADLEIARKAEDGVASFELTKRIGALILAQRQLRDSMKNPPFAASVREQKFLVQQLQMTEGAVEKLGLEMITAKSDMAFFTKELGQGGHVAANAAKGLLGIGASAKTAADAAHKAARAFAVLESQGVKLTDEQRREQAELKRLYNDFLRLSQGVDKARHGLAEIGKTSRRAGQGFRLYTEELGASIRQNFKFINAMTVVTSVLFGVRAAFTQLLEESRAFSRTMTVMQSDTKSFEAVFAELKDVVRSTAIEFGERIETVAEVVKQFGSAGFTAEESMAALNSTMKLIISTQANAEESAKAVAGIYRVFGDQIRATSKEGEEFAKINDVLVSVYRNHQVELDELVQGFRFASASSKLAGFSFEETAAFLAVLNDNMIKSGAAGRGLQVTFAQTAKKSEQIAKALNIKLDPNADLKTNFLKLLKEVGVQMESGIVSSKDLAKQFKIFGLRGTKSFITLARNAEQLDDAFDELKNNAAGVSDELAGIVKGEFAKQFESAKLSLLDFARAALDTLMPIFIFFVDMIKSARDLAREFPALTSGLLGLGGFIAVGVSIIMTLWAVVQVMNVLRMDVMASAAAMKDFALSSWGAARGVAATGAASTTAAIQTGLMFDATASATIANAAMTESNVAVAASSSTASASVGRMTAAVKGLSAAALSNPLTAVLVGLALVAGGIAAVSTSVRELKQDMADASNVINKVGRDRKSLDKLSKSVNELNGKAKDGLLTTGLAAKEVLAQLNHVSDDLIQKSDIMSMTQEELAANLDMVVVKIDKRIARQQLINKLLEDEARITKEKAALEVFQEETSFDVIDDTFTLKPSRVAVDLSAALEGGGTSLDSAQILEFNKVIAESFLETDANIINVFEDYKAKWDDIFDNENFHKLDKELAALERATTARDLSLNFDLADPAQKEAADKVKKIYDDQYQVIRKMVKSFDDLEKASPEGYKKFITSFEKDSPKAFKTWENFIKNAAVESRKIQLPTFKEVDLIANSWDKIGVLVRDNLEGPLDDVSFEVILNGLNSVTEKFNEIDELDKRIKFASASKVIVPIEGEYKFTNDDTKKSFKTGLDSIINASLASFDTDEAAQTFMKDVVRAYGSEFDKGELEEALKLGSSFNFTEGASALISNTLIASMTDASGAISATGSQVRDLGSILGKHSLDVKGVERAYQDLFKTTAQTEALGELSEAYGAFFDGFVGAQKKQHELNSLLSEAHAIQLATHNLGILAGKNDAIDDATNEAERLERLKLLWTQLETQIQEYNTAAANTSGEQPEAEQRGQALALQQLETVKQEIKERQALNAMIKKHAINVRKSELALKKSVTLSNQQTLNARSALGDIVLKNKLLAQEVKANFILQRMQRDAIGEGYYNAEQVSKNLELMRQRVDAHRELVTSLYEETQVRQEISGDIERILRGENTRKSLASDLKGKIAEIGRIQNDMGASLAKGIVAQANQTKLLREYVDVAGEAFDIFESIKELKEESAELDNDEIGILKELIAKYGEIKGQVDADLKKTIKRDFELNSFSTAQNIAEALGVTMGDVLAQQDRFTEKFIRGIEDGSISISGLKDSYKGLGAELKRLNSHQSEYKDEVVEISRENLNLAKDDFKLALKAKKWDEAKEALARYRTAASDIGEIEGDQFGQTRFLQKALDMQRDLSGQFDDNALMIKISYDEAALTAVMDEIRARLEGFQKTLEVRFPQIDFKGNGLAIAKGAALVGVGQTDATKQELDKESATIDQAFKAMTAFVDKTLVTFKETLVKNTETSAKFGEVAKSMKSSVDDNKGLIDTLMTVMPKFMKTAADGFNRMAEALENTIPHKHLAKGGSLPGFGGGDSIPAMLEPGEFVMPKNVVAKYGVDYFEALRTGRVKGFTDGGSAVAAARGGVSVSVSSSSSAASVAAARAGAFEAMKSFYQDKVAPVFSDISDGIKDRVAAVEKGINEENKKATEEASGTTAEEQFAKKVEDAFKFINTTRIRKFLFDAIIVPFKEVIPALGDFVGGELTSLAEAALTNAEALQALRDQMVEIRGEYQRSSDAAVLALQRNETSYYDYLNALQDAERARIEAQIEAEKTYRDAVVTSAELIKESFSKALDGTITSVSEIVGRISGDYLDSAVDNAALSFAAIGKGEFLSANKTGGAFSTSGNFDGSKDSTTAGKIAEAFIAVWDAFGETVGETNEEIQESTFSWTEFGGAMSDALDGLVTLVEHIGELGTAAAGLAFEGLLTGFQAVASLGLEEDPQASADAMVKFAEDLPEVVVAMVDTFVENFPRIMDALAESLPVVIDSLVEGLPVMLRSFVDALSESLPGIIDSLAKALPILVQQLAPILIDLLLLIVSQIPKIIGAIAKSIPILIKEIIKKLPEIIGTLIIAVVKSIGELISGLFSGIFGFSSGGPVPGGYGGGDTIPAMLEPGEFVIPKHVVRDLGSPFFESIRSGKASSGMKSIQGYKTGGLVGDRRSQFSFAPSGGGGNNTSVSTVNTVNVNPQLTGNESDENIIDRGKMLADVIDEELARKVADRDSKLANSLR